MKKKKKDAYSDIFHFQTYTEHFYECFSFLAKIFF